MKRHYENTLGHICGLFYRTYLQRFTSQHRGLLKTTQDLFMWCFFMLQCAVITLYNWDKDIRSSLI